jgi:methionyl-tRNA formyltransferase
MGIVATISPYVDAVREELMARTSFGFAPDRDLPRPPARRADPGSGPRVLFVGFPSDYSLAFLLGLLQLDVRVCGIVTSPGAHPAILGDNALSRIADHLGVPLLRTWRINDDHSRIDLAGLRPEAAVMASFNQIVNAPTLRIPGHGFINVHPSLLPQYRGPEPVYWVIADGAARTGITLHRAVPKVDAGPILAQAAVAVDPHDTSGTLTRRLVEAGVPLLRPALEALLADAPGTVPDLHAGSYLPSVGHRRLDEAPSAAAAERMVRAGVPNMPAWTRVGGEVAYVLAAQLRNASTPGPDRAPRLSFADGDLALLAVSPSCHCHHDVEDCPHREDARAS